MARRKLSLRSICDLGRIRDDRPGKIELAFDRELAAAFNDCMNRPEDGKSRKIELVVEIRPCDVERGAADSIEVDFRVKSSIPERRSVGNRMQVIDVEGELQAVFNDESPDNPRQGTLDEVAGASHSPADTPITVKLAKA